MFARCALGFNTFFHARLQRVLADLLFPMSKDDWFVLNGDDKDTDGTLADSSFDHFIHKQKTLEKSRYHAPFMSLGFTREHISSVLANGSLCDIEVLRCSPEESLLTSGTTSLAGQGKHIVYFTGAATLYQQCFIDIATATKETGATVHAFNYPGMGSSTGRVKEANDLTNAGITMINNLLNKGIHPDNIILLGDSFGAATAYSVKKEYKTQSGLLLRIVMSNTFKSFKAVLINIISRYTGLPENRVPGIKKLLEFTGWHVTPGKDYQFSGPYQCFIQHEGDQLLSDSSVLAGKIEKYLNEAKTGTSDSNKRLPLQDNCPEEYLNVRNELDQLHLVRVRTEALPRLQAKGVDKEGKVNAHFANLSETETVNGASVYTDLICKFIEASDRYINNGRQQAFNLEEARFPLPLRTCAEVRATREQAQELQHLIEEIEGTQEPELQSNLESTERFSKNS